jgi:hypothetical protein
VVPNEWVALVVRIREVASSNIILDTWPEMIVSFFSHFICRYSNWTYIKTSAFHVISKSLFNNYSVIQEPKLLSLYSDCTLV